MAALPAASHSPLTQHQVSKAAQHTFSAKKATTSPEPPRKSSASKAASVATKSLDMHHSASSASRHATSPPHVASQASITLRSDGRPRISTISHQVSKSLPSGGLATRATGPSVSSRTSAQPARPVCSVNCTPSHTATSYSALSNAKSKASAQTSVRPALSGPPEAVRQTHHPLTIHDSASSARFGPAGQLQAQSHTHSSSAATSGASVSRSETIPKHKNEAASASSRPASQLTIHPSALQDSSISLRTGHPPIASAGSAIASGATNASATRASSLITSVTGSQGLRSSQTARRSDMSSADSQTNIVQTSAQGAVRAMRLRQHSAETCNRCQAQAVLRRMHPPVPCPLSHPAPIAVPTVR
ncbi:uncharacterized protein L969DRAFT_172027 [Mixia osmundae IAM 14324]|uniref:uncharacterized protein n=1 Tax=Mixia osmundae (strain CBS 9802 / IAM 14324 / JCM 22182 / KY 12970) TaxID=764103 RepID=UPI0004A54E78|nr:uncharacterized protein L969DRAFT_172027 [Mixia osmundae IAM 14324]KEI42695.1 hypothetical protein L969DRAFT_172027 [Mixia osmundae IAM 14324]